jgi:flavorubredoxin
VADIDKGMGSVNYHGTVAQHYMTWELQQTERMGSANFHARLIAWHRELQQTMVDLSKESGEEEEITQIADYHGMVVRHYVTRELKQTIVDSSEKSGEED